MKGIPQGRYTKEFRQEAEKLIMEDGLSWGKAARRLSLPASTLANWVKAAKAGKLGNFGKKYRPLTEVEMELSRVKKENAELRMERDILKKQPRTLPGSRCPVRDDGTDDECVNQWLLRLGGPATVAAGAGRLRLELEIRATDQRTRQTYGPARLQHDLAEHDVRVGICRIRRIRKKLGIRCKQKRKLGATTHSKHKLLVAENLLKQQLGVSQPNRVWVSDISYVPTDEGWLYVAGHNDLFTGEVVGYAMGERLTRNLVSQSLYQALAAKRPAGRLIHHSDRGTQYWPMSNGRS